MHEHSTNSIAYSYIRFSHPDQAKGDSLRRQTEAAVAWCQRNGVVLDESTTLQDLGKSAYTGAHRTNPDRNALAAFLKLVEQGKVAHGSYLILENLDRLSREEEVPACNLLTGILMAGVRVVQLSPSELILTDKSNGFDVMRAVMELSRGHGESKIKSERIGKAWREKKAKARADGTLITHRLPAWIELRHGRRVLIPGRAAVVRRIFDLAVAGYGATGIVAKFTAEGVAPFGVRQVNEGRKRSQFSGKWNRAYICNILKDRRAVGEFQPCRADGTADGKPIADYFPAVVSEDIWLAARAAAEQRRRKRGRYSKHLNVFAGLLRDARDGGSYYVVHRGPCREKYQYVLINGESVEGRAPARAFPFASFEQGVLALLREIDAAALVESDAEPDEALVLGGELARVETSIAVLGADMDEHGESPTLLKRLRQKEARQRELIERLAEANRRAASPLSAAWGEAQSLVDALAHAVDPTDARLRLRAALRRIVEAVYLLVVPRGRRRLCGVQIFFAGGARRDYLILHVPASTAGAAARPPKWYAHSLAGAPPFDLRERADAAALEKLLREMDLAPLANGD